MFVFGGSLFPSEDFTNELWELDLVLWEWLPLFNRTTPTSVISLPVPVRDHTAHVVGSKMVVLYGLSSLSTAFFSLVQEYDLSKLFTWFWLRTFISACTLYEYVMLMSSLCTVLPSHSNFSCQKSQGWES